MYDTVASGGRASHSDHAELVGLATRLLDAARSGDPADPGRPRLAFVSPGCSTCGAGILAPDGDAYFLPLRQVQPSGLALLPRASPSPPAAATWSPSTPGPGGATGEELPAEAGQGLIDLWRTRGLVPFRAGGSGPQQFSGPLVGGAQHRQRLPEDGSGRTGKGQRCCVRKFGITDPVYQPSWSVRGKPGKARIQYSFEAEGEWIPENEDPGCSCDCCEYRQFVLRAYLAVTPPADPHLRPLSTGRGRTACAG